MPQSDTILLHQMYIMLALSITLVSVSLLWIAFVVIPQLVGPRPRSRKLDPVDNLNDNGVFGCYGPTYELGFHHRLSDITAGR